MRGRLRGAIVLAVVSLASVAAVPAPMAAESVVALEAPIPLPEVPDQDGVTPPGIALRPDGGMVTAWVDVRTGQVDGRWLGPADDLSDPETGWFVLSPEGSAWNLSSVEVAGGEDGRYLAVWRGPSSEAPLLARPFDGDGSLTGPVQEIASSSLSPPALAARPGGGFVLAWWQQGTFGSDLRFRFLAADGSPAGSIEWVEAPGDLSVAGPAIAIGPDGRFAISFSAYFADEKRAALWARSYTANGERIGELDDFAELASVEGAGSPILHDLAATGAGEFLALWAESPAGGPWALRVRHFHPDGSVGPARRVDAAGAPSASTRGYYDAPSLLALAAAPDGGAVAAWADFDETQEILGRLLGDDGTARSEPFVAGTVPEPNYFLQGLDVDRDAAGRLAFGWGLAYDLGVLPVVADLYRTIRARRFRETLDDCAPLLTLDLRTEPPAPTTDDEVRLVFEGLTDCADLSLADWSLGPGGFHVRAEATSGGCGTFPPFGVSLPIDVGELAAGEYPVEFELGPANDVACVRSFGFHVAQGEAPPPPPPDAPPLTSDEVPGFRTWVRITAAGESVLGAKEPVCIPETLCVSGRVPGRSEVFVRVVGPKPNGRLWPTLVKFTTSTAEIWIEQVSTGQVEYYRLEGASPGIDELPGRFDREGFVP